MCGLYERELAVFLTHRQRLPSQGESFGAANSNEEWGGFFVRNFSGLLGQPSGLLWDRYPVSQSVVGHQIRFRAIFHHQRS